MRWHSDFAKWLKVKFPNTEPLLLADVLSYTSQGVAPEICSEPQFQALDLLSKKVIFDATIKTEGPAPIPIQPPELLMSKFVLGTRSQNKLASLMPALRRCVRRAIELTTCDFTVLQTIRTMEVQKAAVAVGNSRTMKSKHLKQADGFAWAVDLGAWVNGKVDWDEQYYAAIAFAMDQAATEQGIAAHVRWGAAWDRVLSDFGGSLAAYMDEARDYSARFRRKNPGKTALIDMPHFEWVA